MPFEPSNELAVRYVLYSHYQNSDGQDFKEWQRTGRLDHLPGLQHLVAHFRSLAELLTWRGYEGLLVLFYSPGLQACFDGIRRRETLAETLRKAPELEFSSAVASWLSQQISSHSELSRRFRFVTPIDLHSIFARLNQLRAQNLPWWFIGPTKAILYDTPKIVESIVRLRLLGTGIPVFRVDWDVLFRGDNAEIRALELDRQVASCLEAFRLRLEEPTVATFMFSASYDTRNVSEGSDSFADWRGAFATRVFPALPIVRDSVDKVTRGEWDWEQYATKEFVPNFARRFYGLTSSGSLQGDQHKGLVGLGAHPLVSVISGALLCLSDGAILDLPPFSNFGRNVSWIDDHLKYCLHRELRHWTTIELTRDPLLNDAKLDDVMVQKRRAKLENLPTYVLANYLPTLLRGSVMDSWITPNPILKCRPEDLSPKDKETWRQLHTQPTMGLLPAALAEALRTNDFDRGAKIDLIDQLEKTALTRINELRDSWKKLRLKDVDTFASAWARGTAGRYFPGLDQIGRGIAPGVRLSQKIRSRSELNPALAEDLGHLMEDATEYINWVLNWPSIVQVVRSIQQGTLKTDISWMA